MAILTNTTVDTLVLHYQRVSQNLGYTILPPEADLRGLAWRSNVLKHNTDRAYHYLQTYIRIYPKNADTYEGMGNYFRVKRDTAQSNQYYYLAGALSGVLRHGLLSKAYLNPDRCRNKFGMTLIVGCLNTRYFTTAIE